MHAPSSFPSLPRGSEKPIAFLGSEETHRGGSASFSRFESGTTIIPSTAASGVGSPKALATEDCLLPPLARASLWTRFGPLPSLFSIEPAASLVFPGLLFMRATQTLCKLPHSGGDPRLEPLEFVGSVGREVHRERGNRDGLHLVDCERIGVPAE